MANATILSYVKHERIDDISIISFHARDSDVAFEEAVRSYFSRLFIEDTKNAINLVINLNGIQRLNSSALGPLVQRQQELESHKGQMAICHVNTVSLIEIFRLTRFDKIFPIFDDIDEALTAIKKSSS